MLGGVLGMRTVGGVRTEKASSDGVEEEEEEEGEAEEEDMIWLFVG